MKEEIKPSYPAETLYRMTVTKPAKRLLGIAAIRYRLKFIEKMMHRIIILGLMFLPLFSIGQLSEYDAVINVDDEITLLNSNLKEVSEIDLRTLWYENEWDQRIGFIGDNYRRLKLAFLSVIQNKDNPLEYFVYGKSNVADNVCPFLGIIVIKESYYFKSLEFPTGNSGILVGVYQFFEDPESFHSGIFQGIFSTLWYKDSNATIKYDNRSSVSDRYCNNQFVGTWSEYGKKDSKTANWGESRIPASGDLDNGTGEFYPNEKYVSNGWESFIKAWGGGYSKEETELARKKELEEWWKK